MDKHPGQSTIQIGAAGTEYGNWMSAPFIRMVSIITLIAAAANILAAFFLQIIPVRVILIIVLVILIVFLIWLLAIRRAFSYTGGRVMDKIQIHLMEHLDWDGSGTLLDMGCGGGALSIRCAKTYPGAKITGVDFFGPMWDYSVELCDKNASLEGVSGQCTFQQGDGNALPFEDETFDAVVSNFVYHEIPSENDKTKLILETLRVLKKGGSFCVQDFFDRESMFGSTEELMNKLKEAGISEVYYKGNVDAEGWIPRYVLSPVVIKDIGVLWGKK